MLFFSLLTHSLSCAGTVLKRFDPSKLFSLACQDMVERFHLVISLLFVVVEEMDSSGRWRPLPGLLWQCGQIFGAEMVIDVVKHAVLGKFNQIRPGVYQEFMKVQQPSFPASLADMNTSESRSGQACCPWEVQPDTAQCLPRVHEGTETHNWAPLALPCWQTCTHQKVSCLPVRLVAAWLVCGCD